MMSTAKFSAGKIALLAEAIGREVFDLILTRWFVIDYRYCSNSITLDFPEEGVWKVSPPGYLAFPYDRFVR